MVSPTPFVRDIHPLLALGCGCYDNAINVDEGLVKERIVLLLPNVDPGFVDGLHQGIDIRLFEATAKVASSGRIHDRVHATSRDGHDC